jgi:adenine-specific DNA-methyltransferase
MLPRFFNGEEVIDHKEQKLVDVFIGKTGMINTRKLRKGDTPTSVLVGKGTTKNGTLLLKNIFGEKLFDFSKPVELLLYLISKVWDKDFYVLDFFSGSATTAHAVIQLNAEDGGNRKFIMVQLPEATDEKSEAYKAGYKTICEIGKERIRRAGKKIKEECPLTTQDLDTGFRVLKLDSSNMQDVYYTPADFNEKDLFEDNIKSNRTEEDLLFQTMIELGIELSAKIEKKQIAGKTVWNVGDGYLLACFDENVNETTITEIAKQKPYYFVMRDKSLANDNVADNFEQIFEHYSKDTIRKIL